MGLARVPGCRVEKARRAGSAWLVTLAVAVRARTAGGVGVVLWLLALGAKGFAVTLVLSYRPRVAAGARWRGGGDRGCAVGVCVLGVGHKRAVAFSTGGIAARSRF